MQSKLITCFRQPFKLRQAGVFVYKEKQHVPEDEQEKTIRSQSHNIRLRQLGNGFFVTDPPSPRAESTMFGVRRDAAAALGAWHNRIINDNITASLEMRLADEKRSGETRPAGSPNLKLRNNFGRVPDRTEMKNFVRNQLERQLNQPPLNLVHIEILTALGSIAPATAADVADALLEATPDRLREIKNNLRFPPASGSPLAGQLIFQNNTVFDNLLKIRTGEHEVALGNVLAPEVYDPVGINRFLGRLSQWPAGTPGSTEAREAHRILNEELLQPNALFDRDKNKTTKALLADLRHQFEVVAGGDPAVFLTYLRNVRGRLPKLAGDKAAETREMAKIDGNYGTVKQSMEGLTKIYAEELPKGPRLNQEITDLTTEGGILGVRNRHNMKRHDEIAVELKKARDGLDELRRKVAAGENQFLTAARTLTAFLNSRTAIPAGSALETLQTDATTTAAVTPADIAAGGPTPLQARINFYSTDANFAQNLETQVNGYKTAVQRNERVSCHNLLVAMQRQAIDAEPLDDNTKMAIALQTARIKEIDAENVEMWKAINGKIADRLARRRFRRVRNWLGRKTFISDTLNAKKIIKTIAREELAAFKDLPPDASVNDIRKLVQDGNIPKEKVAEFYGHLEKALMEAVKSGSSTVTLDGQEWKLGQVVHNLKLFHAEMVRADAMERINSNPTDEKTTKDSIFFRVSDEVHKEQLALNEKLKTLNLPDKLVHKKLNLAGKLLYPLIGSNQPGWDNKGGAAWAAKWFGRGVKYAGVGRNKPGLNEKGGVFGLTRWLTLGKNQPGLNNKGGLFGLLKLPFLGRNKPGWKNKGGAIGLLALVPRFVVGTARFVYPTEEKAYALVAAKRAKLQARIAAVHAKKAGKGGRGGHGSGGHEGATPNGGGKTEHGGKSAHGGEEAPQSAH